MADIKTRDIIKGTIKTIDKAAVASERMKQAYILKCYTNVVTVVANKI